MIGRIGRNRCFSPLSIAWSPQSFVLPGEPPRLCRRVKLSEDCPLCVAPWVAVVLGCDEGSVRLFGVPSRWTAPYRGMPYCRSSARHRAAGGLGPYRAPKQQRHCAGRRTSRQAGSASGRGSPGLRETLGRSLCLLNLCAAFSPDSRPRSATPTIAPSWATICAAERPMPEPAPVAMATRSCKNIWSLLLF